MGFYINEKITTELDYRDVVLIGIAFQLYKEQFEETADKEVLQRMNSLVNRLNQEIYDHPDNDKPNGH